MGFEVIITQLKSYVFIVDPTWHHPSIGYDSLEVGDWVGIAVGVLYYFLIYKIWVLQLSTKIVILQCLIYPRNFKDWHGEIPLNPWINMIGFPWGNSNLTTSSMGGVWSSTSTLVISKILSSSDWVEGITSMWNNFCSFRCDLGYIFHHSYIRFLIFGGFPLLLGTNFGPSIVDLFLMH